MYFAQLNPCHLPKKPKYAFVTKKKSKNARTRKIKFCIWNRLTVNRISTEPIIFHRIYRKIRICKKSLTYYVQIKISIIIRNNASRKRLLPVFIITRVGYWNNN